MSVLRSFSLPSAFDVKAVWMRLCASAAKLRPAMPVERPPLEQAVAHLTAGTFRKALDILHPLARAGAPAPQRLLGLMYLNGQGVLPNAAEAAYWLRQAAERGDETAQHQLALVYAIGPENLAGRSALGKWYADMITDGSALTSVDAGGLFPNGVTVAQDYAAAAAWAAKAAEAGHADAQTNYGLLLMTGRGVARDLPAAAEWLRRAADAGHARAKAHLGALLASGEIGAPDWDAGYALLTEAADAADARAQTILGRWLVLGAGERTPDPARGVGLIALAAAHNMPEAQYLMGACTADGVGVPQDYRRAETWWRRGCARDYVPAMLALGKLYGSGALGLRNHLAAAPLLRRAAEAGLYEAQLIYGRYVLTGAGDVAPSVDEAREWFERAAAQRETEEVRWELERVSALATATSSTRFSQRI